MRHAKSSWSDTGLSDHDRPLNKRGRRDAPTMARLLAAEDLVPNLILSSTANRARSTAELFVENCDGIECDVETTDEFYHAPARTYLESVVKFPDSVATAMIVGHNPGMEQLVEVLSGSYQRMPTAATAWFEFDIPSWRELSSDNGLLKAIWRPKEI